MKGPYVRLWALLAAALAVMMLLSTFDDLRIFGHPMAKIICPADNPPQAAGKVVAQKKTASAVPDTCSVTILLIGDSMVEGLSPRLAAYADVSGHRLFTVIWYGSTTERWAETHRIKTYVKKFKPGYIIACIGGNELFVRDVERMRSRAVDTILADIGSVPYVWIGPPNWKPDTGINRLIAGKVGEGRFFLSSGMQLDRTSDGAHPTRRASAEWMDSIVRWMDMHAASRLSLCSPHKSEAKPCRTIILTPDD